jgi:hypothetical protein
VHLIIVFFMNAVVHLLYLVLFPQHCSLIDFFVSLCCCDTCVWYNLTVCFSPLNSNIALFEPFFYASCWCNSLLKTKPSRSGLYSEVRSLEYKKFFCVNRANASRCYNRHRLEVLQCTPFSFILVSSTIFLYIDYRVYQQIRTGLILHDAHRQQRFVQIV